MFGGGAGCETEIGGMTGRAMPSVVMISAVISLLFLFVSPIVALGPGDEAPTFFLRDASGGEFFLSSHVGKSTAATSRGVIINFFASYCAPCREELPVLNMLAPEFEKAGLKVVIVGYKEDFDRILPMLSELKVDRPTVLSDKYGKIGEKYGVRFLPATFIVGRDGVVRDVIRGALPDIGEALKDKVGKM